jgi:hypothetical protein
MMGGDPGGADAVPVVMHVLLDRGPRLWERLGGPRLSVEWRNRGSVELTHGAGRLRRRHRQMGRPTRLAAPASTAAPGHHQENVDQAGGGQDGTCQRGPPHEPHMGCNPAPHRWAQVG